MTSDVRGGRGMVALLIGAIPLALVAYVAWQVWTAPPLTPAQEATSREHLLVDKRADESKRFLCDAAAACKKYDAARLDCATAGNFKTCLRIKMGDDAYSYADMCSRGDIGSAAKPLPPETPNAFECFFLTLRR